LNGWLGRRLAALFRSLDLKLDYLRLRNADAAELLAELLLHVSVEVSS
jgi:hypothetical protein